MTSSTTRLSIFSALSILYPIFLFSIKVLTLSLARIYSCFLHFFISHSSFSQSAEWSNLTSLLPSFLFPPLLLFFPPQLGAGSYIRKMNGGRRRRLEMRASPKYRTRARLLRINPPRAPLTIMSGWISMARPGVQ